MKKLLAISAVTAGLLFTGCTSRTSMGLDTVDLSKTNMQEISSLKRGESCKKWFLFIPFGRNLSADEAAKKAGITHIKYQEIENTDFWFFGSKCLVVYGE
jgi:hypothetical protein